MIGRCVPPDRPLGTRPRLTSDVTIACVATVACATVDRRRTATARRSIARTVRVRSRARPAPRAHARNAHRARARARSRVSRSRAPLRRRTRRETRASVARALCVVKRAREVSRDIFLSRSRANGRRDDAWAWNFVARVIVARGTKKCQWCERSPKRAVSGASRASFGRGARVRGGDHGVANAHGGAGV